MVAAEPIGLAWWTAAVAVAIVLIGSASQASFGVGLGQLVGMIVRGHHPARLPPARVRSFVPAACAGSASALLIRRFV